MLKTIIEILKNSNADAYEVSEINKEGWEFYFIKHSLDQNRAKTIKNYEVKVYKNIDDNKFLGFASGSISPSDNKEEIENKINNLIYQASLVKNNPYELNKPKDAEVINRKDINVEEEAKKFINCFNNLNETETEYLNSYEIFVEKINKHFITSEGIDINDTYLSSTLDIVVNARKGEHEIELYRLYNQGGCDEENIKEEINDLLKFGKDRLNAIDTPILQDVPVIFSTDAAINIYRYFLFNLSCGYIFRKISQFEIGKDIEENATEDKITLKALRYLDNSNKNFAYDEEGAPIKDLVLMENNIPKAYHGSKMFADLVGIKDSFIVSNYEVLGGKKTKEELRKDKYLEIVEFSDFLVHPMSGDIFGEIRLAYYHDGEKIIPVSGGSVSGQMQKVLKDMQFSKEQKQYNNVKIPALTKLNNLIITGIK